MAEDRAQRHLAAILAADVVGYSRLMEMDESGTFARLKAHRKELFEPEISRHNGRIFKLMGDGLLAEFGSVVDAVECAMRLQREMATRNETESSERRIDVRIGITLGDVILDGEDCYGEGVNIAARLEHLAQPGGICVSQTVVDHLGNKLAVGLEDIGEQQVKNIAKPVRAWRLRPDVAPHRKFAKASSRRTWFVVAATVIVLIIGGALGLIYIPRAQLDPSPRQASIAEAPAIAVLPFSNMSGDPALDYFADGVTETMTAGLSRSPEIRVVARTSAAAYKGKSIDVRQIGQELGARYVLEGSVQKGTDRVRIIAQLIDATTGDHVWSDRYDAEGADPLVLQDEVTEKVIGSLAGRHGLIRKKEYDHAWGKDRANLAEYDYFLRASELLHRFTKEGTLQAFPILEEGLQRNPSSAILRISSAWAYFQLFYGGWSKDPAADNKKAYDLTEQALATSELSPMAKLEAHWLKAWLEIFHKNDWDQAWREREIVLSLNPNEASAVAVMSELAVQAGKPDEALASLTRPGIYWDPTYVFTSQEFHLGFAYFMKGDYHTALEHLQKETTLDPLYTLAFLAASYAELGRLDEARATVAKIREKNPDATLDVVRSVWAFRYEADTERLLGALRKAGLPEK